MKWLVPLRPVPDPAVPLRWRLDGTGPEWDGHPLIPNPLDEHALEAALTLREEMAAGEVVVVCVGPDSWEDSLRTALAMGADRAVRVEAPDTLDPLPVAKILAAVAGREAPDLILLGRQSADLDQGQTGPMLAERLGWPMASRVSGLGFDGFLLTATCEVEGGQRIRSLSLPALLSVDPRLNVPRYASLPNILKARRKPLERLTVEALGVDVVSVVEVVGWDRPFVRPSGQRLESVEALVQKLSALGFVPESQGNG